MTSAQVKFPAVSPEERRRLLGATLRDVSRSFYLSIRALPGGLREPVGLAYLLARAADTIADTAPLRPDDRLRLLLLFRSQLEDGPSLHALAEIESALGEVGDSGADAHSRLLASLLPQAFALLDSLSPDDAERVRRVVVTLTKRHGDGPDHLPAGGLGRPGLPGLRRRPGSLHLSRGGVRRRILDGDNRGPHALSPEVGPGAHVQP